MARRRYFSLQYLLCPLYHLSLLTRGKFERDSFFAQSTGISHLLGYWVRTELLQSRKLISRRDNVRDGSFLMQFKNKITDSNLGKVMAKNNDQRLSPGLLKMIKTRMSVNCSNILEISIWLACQKRKMLLTWWKNERPCIMVNKTKTVQRNGTVAKQYVFCSAHWNAKERKQKLSQKKPSLNLVTLPVARGYFLGIFVRLINLVFRSRLLGTSVSIPMLYSVELVIKGYHHKCSRGKPPYRVLLYYFFWEFRCFIYIHLYIFLEN